MSLTFIPASFAHGDYNFKQAGTGDLPRIRQWLSSGHLNGWWVPNEDELSAAMTQETGQVAYIVDYLGLPFAFLYICDPAHDPELSEQVDYPKGTVRIEQFVGDADMIGYGHGVKFIKAFVAAMKDTAGIARLIVLPAGDNLFAQRSFSQAGFRITQNISYRMVPCVLMQQSVE